MTPQYYQAHIAKIYRESKKQAKAIAKKAGQEAKKRVQRETYEKEMQAVDAAYRLAVKNYKGPDTVIYDPTIEKELASQGWQLDDDNNEYDENYHHQ